MLVSAKRAMKNRFRVFRRSWGTYYSEDLETLKQESPKTRDKAEAHRVVAALNETAVSPAFSLHLMELRAELRIAVVSREMSL